MHALLLAITLTAAQPALDDFNAMCAAESGRLWGRSLCGPIVLADPVTREAVAGADGRVFAAKIPESIAIANTSVDWDGRRWTMVMWPLPDDPLARRALMAHESFHRIQQDLGFPSTGPRNAHLDTADARYWMRLEWRALARALDPKASRRDAKRAVEDALAYRAARRALVKEAGEEERLLEMHEGLAEYTGFAVAEPRIAARLEPIAKQLASFEKRNSYVRSFAYASGPAWGTLIEMRDPKWTRSLKSSDDLGAIAARVWKAKPTKQPRGDAAVRAEEDARAEKKRIELAAARAKFVDGAVLTLPIEGGVSFDPNAVTPLGDAGTIYRTISTSASWGKIEVTGGALLTSDWKRLIVPVSGEGYTLTLNEGWRIVDDSRAGDKKVEAR
ncbi:MAG TPA: hypothetical protein VKB93_21670 [Thermoanaerobaculia bacterium]|nr:hypothetical protein [Thermoanaerobaculia bacterium]